MHKGADAIRQLFAEQGLQLGFPEGIPNLQPTDIRITDPAPIVRMGKDGGLELVIRRWSWPGTHGKPVFNLRSEGRSFTRRCLAIADGFYEFTKPDDPKAKRKNKWLFSPVEGGLLGIAAVTQTHAEVGEAFSLLTAEPSPEVAVIHNRQIILPRPDHWLSWLDPSTLLPAASSWSTVSAKRITEIGLET
ncbi:SOS response-associated peptidase family protein [Sphingomonas sp. RB56-2]|uniref:SOS response-associated peptidase family protein n=1 Tax=Sphingomonas brevis TaxID=2908206 RepID=A0ABT0SAZ0_9SPHN|nr:SOS response-associated peptidase family protein [Sphingomonas brevis]MCL6741518.1 SOS response-associated peptidase family protein [Sphingomonas brevis]